MKFAKSSLFPHFYVFNEIFIIYNDALNYCDENNIPIDFIVKTKYYLFIDN